MKKHLVIDCRMIDMSGIGTYLKNIVPGIIASNLFQVTVLGSSSIKKYGWINSVNFIEFNSPILSINEQLAFVFKIPKCDILWVPNWNIPLLPCRYKNLVVTIHDVMHLVYPSFFNKIKLALMRFYLKMVSAKATNVITVSESSLKDIVKFFPSLKQKISFSYLALNNELTNKTEVVHKPLYPRSYVLMVGNVKPHKNIQLVIDVFSKSKLDVDLVIVGKREGFITSISNLQTSDNIYFTGEVSVNDLIWYYKNCKLFLLPSLYEGFGLPLLEAMHFGKPILASDIPVLKEIASTNINYFKKDSHDDFKEKLDQLLNNLPSIVDYHLLLSKFSWDKTIAQHINILNKHE